MSAIEARSVAASRRYAGWDGARFLERVGEPARALSHGLRGSAARERVLGAWLELAVECAGRGYLDGGLLEVLLLREAPARLPALRVEPVALLAQLFNLGEGLRRDLPWLDRYAASALPRDLELTQAGAFVTQLVGLALGPCEPRPLTGHLRARRVDLRHAAGELLPDELALVAPRLVAVTDRDDPALAVGVLITPSACEVLGAVPRPARSIGDLAAGVRFTDQRVDAGGSTAWALGLREVRDALSSPAGFIAAIAEDSQSIWIVQPVVSP